MWYEIRLTFQKVWGPIQLTKKHHENHHENHHESPIWFFYCNFLMWSFFVMIFVMFFNAIESRPWSTWSDPQLLQTIEFNGTAIWLNKSPNLTFSCLNLLSFRCCWKGKKMCQIKYVSLVTLIFSSPPLGIGPSPSYIPHRCETFTIQETTCTM